MRVYRLIDPPSNPPLFCHEQTIAALQKVYESRTSSRDAKLESLYFLKDFLPSERDELWHFKVEAFLKLQKQKN